MTDIVERLRDAVSWANHRPLCEEAADEIERLRKQLATARDLIDMWRKRAFEAEGANWHATEQSRPELAEAYAALESEEAALTQTQPKEA